jgi:hypothetical protein
MIDGAKQLAFVLKRFRNMLTSVDFTSNDCITHKLVILVISVGFISGYMSNSGATSNSPGKDELREVE